MDKTQPLQIKDVLKAAITKAQAQQRTAQRLQEAWQKAAGGKAARHSFPQRIINKTLIIKVDSSAWIYYLHNHRRVIEQRLRKQLSAQHDIRIRLHAGE
jgi:predicted nucleic acid-binding Zn ribbon protein